jgi:hypothetical protein
MKSQAEPPKQTRFNLHPPASRYATRTMRSTVSTVCKATAGVSVYTRNDVPKLDPQSRIAPAPTPHSRIKRSVPPTSETLKPQRDALDFIFIRDASVGTQPDRPCGREGSTLNRMDPVQMRMSRAQPKAVDCVSDATNRYLREWQANSYKSDSSCPNRANVYVREAPTNYRRNPRKQVKAADSPYSYFLIRTIVMSSILITTTTLQTPTWTIPILYCIILASVIAAHAPLVHSNLAYSPSPGTSNLNVALGETGSSEQKLPAPTTESKKETHKEASQTEPTLNTCDSGRARTNQGDPTTHRPPPTPLTMTMKSVNNHKKSAPRDHLQHLRKLTMPSTQRPTGSNSPSTHPTTSP